jgi:hypothetical protein
MNTPSKLPRKVLRSTASMAVVVLMACSVSVESGGEPQNRALIDRLPAGATAIAWIDFEALAEAMPQEKWDAYEEMLQGDEDMGDLERFTEATGIDPREDLMQLAFAALPTAAEPDDYLVLMSADFDEDKLLELAVDAESVTYEGATFYAAADVFRALEEAVAEPEGGDASGSTSIEAAADRPGYLSIIDDETLAMGSQASLEVVVDVDSGRRDSLKMDPVMNDLISDVAGEGQIWFVGTRETWDERIGDLGQGNGPMVPTSAIESIEVLTMSLRMGEGMTMRITGIAATADAATELTTSLNGLLAMGRMMLQQNEPELFAIIDRGISVSQDDRTIRIQADLTDADIEVLQRMADEQMPAR